MRLGHGQLPAVASLFRGLSGSFEMLDRKGGFESEDAAHAELDETRALLSIPKPGDVKSLTQIGDLIADAISAKQPLARYEDVKKRVRRGRGLRERVKAGPYLLGWLPGRKSIAKNTCRSYEAHIRLYLGPANRRREFV